MARTFETNRDWRAYWSSVGQRAGSDELFAQVDRTVSGRAVSSSELQLIVEAVVDGIRLAGPDTLLDLCCGNGLITKQFALHCQAVIGVDYSEYLIGVAKQDTSVGNVTYVLGSVEDLDSLDFGPCAPTKVSINGGLQHFTLAMLQDLLESLNRRAKPVTDMIFTEVPDADRLFAFYNTPERREEFHRRRAAGLEPIGTWWAREEMAAVLDEHGYETTFPPLRDGRLTNHYRFDVVAKLRRGAR